MDSTKIKVAILGGSICGLACAIELERYGIVPTIFERDTLVPWVFPSVSFLPYVFYNKFGNPRKYLLEQYKVDYDGITEINSITMKSPNNEVKLKEI